MEAEVVYMITVLIYQASSSVPPLSTPIIDLSPRKLAPSTTQVPIFTTTTTTTTTTCLLLPPPQQQSITDSELVARVTALEQKFTAFEHKCKTLDSMTQNLGSRVFTLELRDLPHKIDETVRETVKEVVQVALQAPLRDRFRDLPEADMKKMLHQRMFRDEFFAKRDKSRKRRRDDQDPPPPPLDSDLNKKKPYNSGTSGSSQPPAPQSFAWKMIDTRDATSSSSKQQSGPHSEQPIEDIPMPDTANISYSEDTGSVHLLKIKPRPEWLKPILEENRPESPEPDSSILLNDLLEQENNWANALANSYKDPE
ncbi:hypothetical protein Tco_1397175 [Tanacetum coccineum]